MPKKNLVRKKTRFTQCIELKAKEMFKDNTKISTVFLMRKFKINHDFASEIMRNIRLECHKEARKITRNLEDKQT